MSGLGGPGGRGGPGGPVTLTHAEAEALISARLDGPLDPVANRTLLAHLAGCPSCRAFASRMEVMTRGFRELPLLPASPTVSREVRQRVAAGRSPWDRLGSALGGGRLGPMPAAVGALVLVAALAFVIIFRGGDDNRPPGVGAPSSTVSGMNATPTPEPTETGTTASESTPTVRVVNTPTPTPEAPTATATLPANVNATVTPTPTPTEEPATATAEPTQTPEPTETPTEEPSATATATEEPSPTATEEPTEEPTLTPTEDPTAAPTEEPTATPTDEPTETATAEPTETATEQPTETPTEEPTQTPEPTSTPTEEPTETPEPTETAEPTETPTPTPTEEPTETATPEATPTAEPTEEPTEEPTPTQPGIQPREGTTPIPVDDSGEGEFETQAVDPTEEVVEEPTEEPTEEATEETDPGIEQRGGDDEEEQTAEPDAEETPPPADEETPETEETQQGGQGGGAADLADGETDVDLPGGAAAPPGPLLLDPSAERFVYLDGGSLAIANRGSGETATIGAGFWPSWSTLGNNVLYAYSSESGTAVVSWDRDNGASYDITEATNADGRPVSDAPAGWIESQIYFVRSYADQPGRLELHRTEFDGTGDTIIWESDSAVLAGERPFATPSGVLIPTDGGWVLAGDGGGEVIDSVTYAPGGAYEVLGSSIAYQSGGEVIVASVGAPGQGVVLPGGDGFAWSPDGTQLVVIDGGSLSIYSTGGELVGSVANDSGIPIAAPQWTSDGILYLDLANAVVRRLPVEAFFG